MRSLIRTLITYRFGNYKKKFNKSKQSQSGYVKPYVLAKKWRN